VGSKLYYWKCMMCESKTPHKGLCRSCTTYDEEGQIIEPVRRIKINKDGTPFESHTHSPIIPLHERDGFRRKKKPSKKQLKRMEEHMAKYRPPTEDVVTLLGESDEEE
jgi:hypothetical protein